MPRVILISIDGLAHFYWNDPMARMPVLRGLAQRGVVADGMATVFISTTWPSHVSLVTGVGPRVHGVVANHILNRASARPEDLTGDPVYDAVDLVRAPTIYDRAHAAGLRTAAIDWPATRRAASLDFNLPFFKSQQIFETQTAPGVWAELRALGYPVERQGEWAELPRRFLKDAMVADLAIDVLRRHAPDLLLVHFLCADSHQHLYGPRSPEAYWAIAYIDGLVGRVLAALGGDGLDRSSVVVVSDHGFLPVTREIRPNVRLRRRGLLRLDAEGNVAHAEARFVMNHGAGWVYAMHGDRHRLARDLRGELASLEGVAAVWTPQEYAGLGLPTPDENPRAGDLLLEAAPGYFMVDQATGDQELGAPRYRGTHGQRPMYPDNHALFLAAGRGIQRGMKLGPITSRDVAPTLATLFDLPAVPTEGRALSEILAQPRDSALGAPGSVDRYAAGSLPLRRPVDAVRVDRIGVRYRPSRFAFRKAAYTFEPADDSDARADSRETNGHDPTCTNCRGPVVPAARSVGNARRRRRQGADLRACRRAEACMSDATRSSSADAEWDAGELGCGELVLELRGRLQAMRPGETLRLTARDAGAPADIPAWCRLTGHALVLEQHPVYLIRRKEN